MATTDNSLETRTPPFLPVTRDGLVDRVADSLAEAILAGRMAPGDRIAESTIARQMDLSRAPVREALRRLESSGLVDYKTNRGFFVHAITGESLANLYELRIVIETAAVARLVRTNAGAALPGLQAQLDELRRLAEVGADMATHVSADMEFHRMICAASGNPRFLQVFDQIAITGGLTANTLVSNVQDGAKYVRDGSVVGTGGSVMTRTFPGVQVGVQLF